MNIRFKRNPFSDPNKVSPVAFEFIEILAVKPVVYAPNRDGAYDVSSSYLVLTNEGVRLLKDSVVEKLFQDDLYVDASMDDFTLREWLQGKSARASMALGSQQQKLADRVKRRARD